MTIPLQPDRQLAADPAAADDDHSHSRTLHKSDEARGRPDRRQADRRRARFWSRKSTRT